MTRRTNFLVLRIYIDRLGIYNNNNNIVSSPRCASVARAHTMVLLQGWYIYDIRGMVAAAVFIIVVLYKGRAFFDPARPLQAIQTSRPPVYLQYIYIYISYDVFSGIYMLLKRFSDNIYIVVCTATVYISKI